MSSDDSDHEDPSEDIKRQKLQVEDWNDIEHDMETVVRVMTSHYPHVHIDEAMIKFMLESCRKVNRINEVNYSLYVRLQRIKLCLCE